MLHRPVIIQGQKLGVELYFVLNVFKVNVCNLKMITNPLFYFFIHIEIYSQQDRENEVLLLPKKKGLPEILGNDQNDFISPFFFLRKTQARYGEYDSFIDNYEGFKVGKSAAHRFAPRHVFLYELAYGACKNLTREHNPTVGHCCVYSKFRYCPL